MKKIFLLILAISAVFIGCLSADMEPGHGPDDTGAKRGQRPLGFGMEHPEKLLSMTNDGITIRYSEGYEDVAGINLKRLNGMVNFYKEELGIDFEFQLWMADEEDWPKTGAPYGMPSCDTAHNAVLVPAAGGGCIYEAALPQLGSAPDIVFELFEKAGVTPEEGVHEFPLLIGYHEIGHILMSEYGFDNATRWFNEFLASYHGLAYMAEHEPEMAAIWMANAYISPYEAEESPAVVDLEAMNRGDVEPVTPEGVKNYDWFQKEFMKLCIKINDELGVDFIHKVKESIGSRGLGTEGELAAMRQETALWDEWIADVQN